MAKTSSNNLHELNSGEWQSNLKFETSQKMPLKLTPRWSTQKLKLSENINKKFQKFSTEINRLVGVLTVLEAKEKK